MRLHVVPVVQAKVVVRQLLQQALDVLVVRQLAARAQHCAVVHLVQALERLIPLGRAVGACSMESRGGPRRRMRHLPRPSTHARRQQNPHQLIPSRYPSNPGTPCSSSSSSRTKHVAGQQHSILVGDAKHGGARHVGVPVGRQAQARSGTARHPGHAPPATRRANARGVLLVTSGSQSLGIHRKGLGATGRPLHSAAQSSIVVERRARLRHGGPGAPRPDGPAVCCGPGKHRPVSLDPTTPRQSRPGRGDPDAQTQG